jgi:hypothetical protein
VLSSRFECMFRNDPAAWHRRRIAFFSVSLKDLKAMSRPYTDE